MKKLKLDGKMELTKDEMKKINGGYYACIFQITAECGGGSGAAVCTGGQSEGQCYIDASMWCISNSCCEGMQCN